MGVLFYIAFSASIWLKVTCNYIEFKTGKYITDVLYIYIVSKPNPAHHNCVITKFSQ